ncbi:MAG: acetyltransferase [Leptospira sp.]|nr:acetyltransferase [Leptospira sp.]
MKKYILILAAMAFVIIANPAFATAKKSAYPVVFAHGLGGFDNLLGAYYFGDDYGVFVGDPCDEFLEVTCNSNISTSQKALAGNVAPFNSSEIRGLQLANQIESYLTTVGSSYVNIIGHSQGGIDARKAAAVLKQRKGYAVVKVLASVSSPHRGSGTAKYILDLKPGVVSVIASLAAIYGNSVYAAGNDVYAAAKQLVYNDYSAADGITTGMKDFNTKYNVNSAHASKYISFVTAQQGVNLNPALFLVVQGFFNADGDGYCVGDCDNDGAAGQGNGNKSDTDDDGLVGVNSAQMGQRAQLNDCFLCLDYITINTSLGNVTDLNNPSSLQMTSKASVINQDHADVVGLGPDTFDEKEFYAAIIDYIANNGG